MREQYREQLVLFWGVYEAGFYTIHWQGKRAKILVSQMHTRGVSVHVGGEEIPPFSVQAELFRQTLCPTLDEERAFFDDCKNMWSFTVDNRQPLPA